MRCTGNSFAAPHIAAICALVLAEHPELRDAKGAHGIPLVVHAQQGGEQAKAVLELLEAA